MARKKDEVGPLVEKLAIKVAEDALGDRVTFEDDEGTILSRETTFNDRLDALSKLTAYQTGIMKAKAKNPKADEEEEPESGTILDFQKRLREANKKEE